MTRFAFVLAIALVVAAPAFGAYPGTYALQNGASLVKGPLRIDASRSGGDTRVTTATEETTIGGAYGIPTLIPSNTPLGLFRDGARFVLQSTENQSRTSFVVVRTADLTVLQRISLRGSYAFDALSPNGSRLYLIQHTTADFGHYIVRAYDLQAQRLLPGR